MIEMIANSDAVQTQPTKPAARDDIAPGFSFSAAMIALEGRASSSLKTFGAAPSTEAPGQSVHSASDSSSKTVAAAPVDLSQESVTSAPRAPGAKTQKTTTGAALDPQQAPQQTVQMQAQPPTAALVAATPTAAISVQQSSATRVEAAAIRDTALAKTTAPKAPRPVQLANLPAQTQNFAQFLAKKLDSGATSFELRLDPPQLGRVDAHMTVGDDGEAVVSLQFENQTALDLFARDEAGLRTALSSSGHDFDQHQFTFSLRDRLVDANVDPASTAITASFYDPVFAAPFSTGAVDLRL